MSGEPAEEDAPDEIGIHLEKSEDYRKYHVNGVRGGFQPRGDFKLDFLVDTNPIPGVEYYQVEAGRLGSPHDDDLPEGHNITREIQTSIMADPNHMYSMAAWTIAQLFQDATEEQIQQLVQSEFDPVPLGPPEED